MYYPKTKLVATVGPSIDKFFGFDFTSDPTKPSPEIIEKFKEFVSSGVTVVRFNMSHGSFESHLFRFKQFRTLNALTNNYIGIMIDTKGPEIRVGNIQEDNVKENIINLNDTVVIKTKEPSLVGNGKSFFVSDVEKKYNLANDLSVGDRILIEDGKLILVVKENNPDKGEIITTSLTDKYTIKTNKRLNLFNKKYSLPFLSEYDEETIKFAVENDADFIALSFISNLEQVNDVKQIIKKTNPNSKLKLICKIENPEGIEKIKELVQNTDGIMVARGDLALEIGYEKVPHNQDLILKLCNKYNKISIVATQMLDSLETKVLPTRAEVTDCYYAVKLNADSTMLSGESASGDDPINAIRVMKQITNEAEKTVYLSDDESCACSCGCGCGCNENESLVQKIINATKANNNILLTSFSESEIVAISSEVTNKNFFVLADEHPFATKYSLYKNLTVVKKPNSDFYQVDKNKLG